MKHFTCLLLSILLLPSLFAQQKSIEMFDLFKMLSPDSLDKGNAVNWNNLNNNENKVYWNAKTPVTTDGKFSQKGGVVISLYNNTFSCASNIGPCLFKVFAEGDAKGYNRFSIDHTPSETFKPEQKISFLFNQHLKYRLIKKIKDGDGISLYTYELKFAGKKPIWLAYGCVYTPKGNGIYLKAYLNEKDLTELDVKNDGPAPTTPAEKLTPAAAALFKGCKTTLNNGDKNAIQVLSGYQSKTEDIQLYPTDLNYDGIEEIFIQEFNFEMYGNAGAMTTLYIKNNAGKFEKQEDASAPYLSIRKTSNKGYPDLIAGGPGFRFSVYRWNGTRYEVFKMDQPTASTDKMIDEVSKAYTSKKSNMAKPTDKKQAVTAPLDKAPVPVTVSNSKAGLGFLAEYAKSGKDIFSNKDFIARLKKLLGTEYARMMNNWDLSTGMVAENGLFYHWGMQAHNGGFNETTIIADIENNALYVKMLKDGKTYYFSEDGKKTIPANILDWATKVSNRGK